MAITIQAFPAAFSSVHGDLIYTVAEVAKTADPVTYPNYKFVGDVYVGSTLIQRLKKVPDPVTRIGIFNIGQIVRNYINSIFNPSANSILAQRKGNGDFSLSVTMKFGEEYSFTTYTNLTVDSARVFFNNYNGRLAGTTTNLADLVDKPLTDRPYQTPVSRSAAYNFIPFLPSTTGNVTTRIKTYDVSGTLARALNFTMSPAAAYELLILNLSTPAINAVTPDLINASIDYFTVEFDGAGTDLTYKFDLTCEAVYDTYNLHFLNKYGGFESKAFTKVSRRTLDIQRSDYGKLPYTIDISGVVSYKNTNGVYNESRAVYASTYKEKMVLNSDLLTDGEYRWLEQLVLSPLVYIEENGYFYPIVITDNNYEPKRVINDDLTNLTLNIEFGEQLNAQFR
jgi:hypothetical protein